MLQLHLIIMTTASKDVRVIMATYCVSRRWNTNRKVLICLEGRDNLAKSMWTAKVVNICNWYGVSQNGVQIVLAICNKASYWNKYTSSTNMWMILLNTVNIEVTLRGTCTLNLIIFTQTTYFFFNSSNLVK